VIEPVGLPASRWLRPATILLWLLAAAALAGVLATLFVRAPRVNEGWNALHALHAVTRPNLYLPDGYANFPNYPPLAFYPVGWIGLLIGDMVFAGRLLAAVGLAVVVLNVALVARQLASPPWLAAGLYLFLTLGMSHYYIGASDPQFFGHALQATALPLLLGRRTTPAVVAAAILCVLGGLVKLNLVALPLAATAWLAITDRRALLTWLAAAVLASLAAVVCCYLAFGAAVFEQVLGHERAYRLELIASSIRWMGGYLPLVVAGLWLAIRQSRDSAVLLLGLYVAIAVVTGLFFAGGVGVNLNTYFDVAIASAPLGVAAILRMRPRPQTAMLALVGVAVAYLGIAAAPAYLQRWNAPAVAARYAEPIATLRALPGTAFCNDLIICYWAGKDSIIDRSNTAQKLLAGPAAVAAFEAAFASDPPAVVQLEADDGGIVARSVARLLSDYRVLVDAPVRILIRN
jgi:hypothetical protein